MLICKFFIASLHFAKVWNFGKVDSELAQLSMWRTMSENSPYPKQKIFLFNLLAKDERTISELWAKDKLSITELSNSAKPPKNSIFFYFSP